MRHTETASTQSNEKRDVFQQFGALASIVGPILFVLVFTIDGFLKAGYNAMSQAVSYLAVGANGWILDANFIVLGLLLILFALGFSQWMRPLIKQTQLLVSTIFLLLVGLGFTTAGIFIAPAPGELPNTLHVVLHTVSFNVIFFSLSIACVIIGWQLRKTVGWRGYGWYSIITGVVTIIPTLGLLAAVFAPGTQSTPPPLSGLFNRIFVVEALAWYVIMGCRLLALKRARKSI